MQEVFLFRNPSTEQGTFGYIYANFKYWYTLELPNKDNKPNISCIPIGEYIVKIRKSPRFGYTYHVKNVKDRTFILIHSANFAGDTSKGYQSHLAGCIAIGKNIAVANNKFKNKQKCIVNSRVAIREFMDELDKDEFKLIIKDIRKY